MKIVVNRGRTVTVAVKPGTAARDNEPAIRPVLKTYGPTTLLEMPDEEAKRLIDLGFARKYEPPRSAENVEGGTLPAGDPDLEYRPGKVEVPDRDMPGMRRA